MKGEAITSDEFVDILEAQKAAGAKERQKTKEREKEGKETIQRENKDGKLMLCINYTKLKLGYEYSCRCQ